MSRLDKLIKEYCPDGVEYKKIKDVYIRLKGTPITAAKMKEIANPDGEIKIFAGGKTIINANEEDIPKPNITRVPAVLVQSRGIIDFVYYEEPFTFKNEMWAYTAENKTSVKFLYYALKNNTAYFREAASGMGSMPQISLRVTEDFLVPIPPLPIQREIVRILDSFTELTSELTSELNKRKKQYEYYRDKVLTFGNDCKTEKVGNVAEIKRGVRVVRNQLSPDKGYPVYQNSMTPLGYYEKYNCHADKTFVIAAGAAGEIGYSYEAFWAADDCYYFECNDSLIERYLYHALMNKKTALSRNVRKASIPRLSRESIEKLEIPVPPLDIQKRIVNVLDNFDALCNDITFGLPAEIAARQKQYEYYRDKLLSFEIKN